MEYDMRPTYYKEYDEVDHVWNIFVTDYDEDSYDFFIADFEDQSVAESVVSCLNDVVMRCWG